MRRSTFIFLAVLGVMVAGCGNTESQDNIVSASSTSDKTNASSKSTSAQTLPVGKVLSRTKMNVDDAYKATNKKGVFYRSLKEFGEKSGAYSNYELVHDVGLTLGVSEKIVTTKGVYYHMVNYLSGGFENDVTPAEENKAYEDQGYIQADYVKPIKTVTQSWTYAHRQPYYLAYPCNHRIWTRPAYTVHYTYISHTFDRLSHTQLYATKELVKRNGSHYLYLETAHQKLGWVYKSPKVLVKGKFVDPGKQLLKKKKSEKLQAHVQSVKSTKNRVGINDSLSMQQRACVVKNKKGKIVRVLIMGMDNRPTKVTFKNGQATKLISYTYRRKPWKTTTSQKKLRHSFWAHHIYIDTPTTKTFFYSQKSKKLLMNKTIGSDGMATTTIYRNGTVKFMTHPYKEIITYPYARFK